MAKLVRLFRNNDYLVEITDLKNEALDTFYNAATVSVTLKDSAGVTVTGVSWPVTLLYVDASDGVYRGVIDKAIAIVLGQFYTAEISAAEGGAEAFWEIPLQAMKREE